MKKTQEKCFTLIELLVVIAVIVITVIVITTNDCIIAK